MAWTAPRTWTTGELVTAALMNTHVRDNQTYLKAIADTVIDTHPVGIQVFAHGATVTTGDGKAYLTIPTEFNGMVLTDAQASVSTQSTAGVATIQIHNLTVGVDMLSTRITIDQNEYTSYSAATASVVNAANDDVSTGNLIRIDVDVAGNGEGLAVILTFK